MRNRPKIFVSIASYRDRFLPFTIEQALAKAAHPERLTFGICWQADHGENLDPWAGDPRFRIRKYRYQASLGYGWSRAEVQKLYDGEDYHLLIDSHSWFAEDWDENLIAQLEAKPSNKPLLTTSSPPFTFDDHGQVILPWAGTARDGVPLTTCEQILPVGWIDIQMSEKRKARAHETTALICCNFVFTHGHWIRAVPEDPAMVNAGHESALSARTFTHGYDIYLPDDVQIWHLDYGNYPDGYRPRVWETKSDTWQADRTQAMIRRLHALIYRKGDPSLLGRYGLGSDRSLDDWASVAGVRLDLMESRK